MNSKHQAWRRDLPSQQGIYSIHMYGIIILNQVQYITMFSFISDLETQMRTRRSGIDAAYIDAAYLPLQLQSAALPSSGLRLPCSTLPSHIDVPLQHTEPGCHTCSDTSTSLQVSAGSPAQLVSWGFARRRHSTHAPQRSAIERPLSRRQPPRRRVRFQEPALQQPQEALAATPEGGARQCAADGAPIRRWQQLRKPPLLLRRQELECILRSRP